MAKKKAWKPPFCEVEWMDASSFHLLHGTRATVIATATLYHRFTTGYLIWQDGENIPGLYRRLVLVHDYDPIQGGVEEPEMGNATVIPTGWVIKIRYLKLNGGKKGEAKPSDASGDKPGGGSAGSDSTAAGVSGPSGATSGSGDAHHGQRDEHQSDQKHA